MVKKLKDGVSVQRRIGHLPDGPAYGKHTHRGAVYARDQRTPQIHVFALRCSIDVPSIAFFCMENAAFTVFLFLRAKRPQ